MEKKRLPLRIQIIKEEIKGQKLKMYWVAMQSGIHVSTLRRWLQGKVQNAQPEKVERLSQTLSVPCRHLIREP